MNCHIQIHHPPDSTVSIRGEEQTVRRIVRLLPPPVTVEMQMVKCSPSEARIEVDFAAQALDRMATGRLPTKPHVLAQLADSLTKAAKAI